MQAAYRVTKQRSFDVLVALLGLGDEYVSHSSGGETPWKLQKMVTI
jgi:hypothetical protein